MEISKQYLNNYVKEEMEAAFDQKDICVSYTGDYRKNVLAQVHNSCELLFVEEGRAEYAVGKELFPVKRNTVLIIGAADRHTSYIREFPYVRYGLNLMPSYLRSLPIVSGYLSIYQTPSAEDFGKLTDIEERIFQRLLQVVWELHEETMSGKEEPDGEMLYALLLDLTLLLKRLLGAKSQENSGTYKVMEALRSYIDLHYSEDLSLARLSSQFYLQPNTISKYFRKTWGKNISQYINSVRIANAVHILETTPVSVTELAAMVGYASVNTFLRQFREKMEVSPLQYRKRTRQAWKEKDMRQLF